jgi:hypothetical protein
MARINSCVIYGQIPYGILTWRWLSLYGLTLSIYIEKLRKWCWCATRARAVAAAGQAGPWVWRGRQAGRRRGASGRTDGTGFANQITWLRELLQLHGGSFACYYCLRPSALARLLRPLISSYAHSLPCPWVYNLGSSIGHLFRFRDNHIFSCPKASQSQYLRARVLGE